MRKALLVVVVLLALAAGGYRLVRAGGGKEEAAVRVVKAPEPSQKVKCRACGREFQRTEGRPIVGREGVITCPHCGRPTPAVARAPAH